MDQRFRLPPCCLDQGFDILDLLLSRNALLYVTEITALHPVLVGSCVNDGILLRSSHSSCKKAQCNACQLSKPAQQSQFLCGGRITTNGDNTSVGPAQYKVVGIEFHCRRRNEVEILFWSGNCRLFRRRAFLFLFLLICHFESPPFYRLHLQKNL